jgi:hypothetical protein
MVYLSIDLGGNMKKEQLVSLVSGVLGVEGIQGLTEMQIITLLVTRLRTTSEDWEYNREEKKKLQQEVAELKIEMQILKQHLEDATRSQSSGMLGRVVEGVRRGETDGTEDLQKLLGIKPVSSLWNSYIIKNQSDGDVLSFACYFDREFYQNNRENCGAFNARLQEIAKSKGFNAWFSKDHLRIERKD